MPAAGILMLAAAAIALPTAQGVLLASAGYAVLGTVLVLAAVRSGLSRTFGAANAITTIRLGLVALLIGATGGAAGAPESWWPAAIAGLALALDGVDGAIARRKGLESRFGALFDQETDALLILVLTLVLTVSGKIGLWIVAAGLMRYVLLMAGLVWPPLAAPLPKSRFRSVVCGVMVGALVICLIPSIAPFYASALAATALSVLTLSFAKDLIWLLKRAPGRTRA